MFGAFDRLRRGLGKTRAGLFGRLSELFQGRVKLDAETLDEIEALLIASDLGPTASLRIVRTLEKRLKETGGTADLESVAKVIRTDIAAILREARPRIAAVGWEDVGDAVDSRKGGKKRKARRAAAEAQAADAQVADAPPSPSPLRVIFVVGVNGTGKTTSIAKLAHALKADGQRVLVAAGDTFRAAAVEQLRVWAERVGVDFVQQGQGADAAAVVFDALAAAEARGHDVVIVDTAGRLHTKTNLMDELGKVARVIRRRLGRDPETLLVVDANTGQNGLQQARVFAETVPVDGLILTKLDGTAKGGIVVAIAETLGSARPLGRGRGDASRTSPPSIRTRSPRPCSRCRRPGKGGNDVRVDRFTGSVLACLNGPWAATFASTLNFGAGCNSPPAVTAREPFASTGASGRSGGIPGPTVKVWMGEVGAQPSVPCGRRAPACSPPPEQPDSGRWPTAVTTPSSWPRRTASRSACRGARGRIRRSARWSCATA